jgi:hypothetical protein
MHDELSRVEWLASDDIGLTLFGGANYDAGQIKCPRI